MNVGATTVDGYLAAFPEERRAVLEKVRAVLKKNMPKGFEEALNYGMISFEIPLSRYPDTYNKQPLVYVALAAQKNYYALYLNCISPDSKESANFRKEFEATGKKLDMGKSCVRFKKLEDLPLDVVGNAVAETSAEAFIKQYEKSRKK